MHPVDTISARHRSRRFGESTSTINVQKPGPLRIGPLHVFPPVLQAPMSALTNLAMRTLSEEQGCGLTVTEFLSASAIASGHKSTLNRITPSYDGRPFGVQIYGRNPIQMAKAGRIVAEQGASLVDINMGCPGKKISSGSCGAALMREPRLAEEIVVAVRQAVDIKVPVTVKMRAGWDASSLNAPSLAAQLVTAGAAMITVHGRTRQQRYKGRVDLSIIRAVKEAVDVPVVANGDIVDLVSMKHTFATTGADGVMIGRAATGNPWIFAELSSWWTEHPLPAPPTNAQRISMYLRHMAIYRRLVDDKRAVIEMRKFAPWYLAGIPSGEMLRAQINRLSDPEEVNHLLRKHLRTLP